MTCGNSPLGGSQASRGARRGSAATGRRIAAFMAVSPLAASTTAEAASIKTAAAVVETLDIIQLAIFVGAMAAAMLSAAWLIRERGKIAAENLQLRTRVAELDASLQRSGILLNLKDQRVVIWTTGGSSPELVGKLPDTVGAPEARGTFLAFGRWLNPQSASELDRAVTGLREKAREFDLVVETSIGKPLEVSGRISSGHTVLRFLSLSGLLEEHSRLRFEHQRVAESYETIRGLVDALDMPFWLRGYDGKLRWVNRAYANAVECEDGGAVLRESREFLGTQARAKIATRHAADPVYQRAVSTVIKGDRRLYSVTDVAGSAGSAGIATDISDMEAEREEHVRVVKSHSETLDQLTTAVAIFDADKKLRFFNHAFQELWDLDLAFLESAPDNTLVLDRLRSDGKLAEQPEWRRWKESVLGAYHSVEPQEHWWHLPDRRTVRVVANPHPKGGVTWVFENLTEKIDLESRYNTAVKVQGETLDNLAEGVAVFGPDGRVRLSNPAFANMWNLQPEQVQEGIHISAIRAACETLTRDDGPWREFVASVTGFDDQREEKAGKAELVNGTILSHALIPLPNGQVMMTFVDMTDSFNVERALKDKNEALQKADQLKNDFVQHVSYELRSPLTNIIGFTELLRLPDTGDMNTRQNEYVDHISTSSSVLLTVVNDILDLATVDAGIMELEIGDVDAGKAATAAAELVAERLRDHGIELKLDVDDAGSFQADEHRVRQILFNLLSNAANYAPEGSTIRLSCNRENEDIVFTVHDEGPGMPPDVLSSVFSRFEPRSNGGRRRGAGLGLSIVKSFVELHGGSVDIDTGEDRGTTVQCRFPSTPPRVSAAAE